MTRKVPQEVGAVVLEVLYHVQLLNPFGEMAPHLLLETLLPGGERMCIGENSVKEKNRSRKILPDARFVPRIITHHFWESFQPKILTKEESKLAIELWPGVD